MEYITIGDLVKTGEVEITTGPFGTQLKASEYRSEGTPVVNVKNIGFGSIVRDKLDKVGDETVQRLQRHILREGDIVFGRKGAVERHSYITEDEDGWMQGSDCIRLRVKSDSYSPRFFSYCFLTKQHRDFMISMCSHGTTMASLNQGILEQIKVPSFNLLSQENVASLLGSIDDKIETNKRINDNLELQARALHRQWITTEKERVVSLSQIADINPETYSPSYNWNFVNYLDTSSITEGVISDIQYIKPSEDKLPSRARRILRKNDIVFSTVRPNQLHYGIISNPMDNMLASTGFAVVRSRMDNIPNEIIYLALTEPSFVEQMQQLAEQSVSTFPSIRPADLDACLIPVPLKDDVGLFDDIIAIFAAIAENNEESNCLASLRDTLLPRLISGEIDVSKVAI